MDIFKASDSKYSQEEIRERFPYLYETHLHTAESSRCASSRGADMARACKEYGYTGIIVTDHAWGGNTTVDRNLPWDRFINEWCKGYEEAKAEGDKIGLQVFFGMEAGFMGTDFLLYGISKEWLLKTPKMWTADVPMQHKLVNEAGGIVVHAHPYREEFYIPEIRLFPNDVDGVEVINATHCSPKSKSHNVAVYNDRAIKYSNDNNFHIITAGSDVHSTELFGGGIAFSHKLENIEDFIKTLKSGEEYALTDGTDYYLASEIRAVKA